MATATELLEEACDSGLNCVGDRDLLVIIAQALSSSLDMTATELLEAACESGIACLDERSLQIAVAEGINQGGGGGGGGLSFLSGVGSPEGVVTASPGRTYVRTDTGGFWIKVTGTGNTGWQELVV